ncbi:DUF6538 domain-containing protein [Roseomonas sp. GCM10028921]
MTQHWDTTAQAGPLSAPLRRRVAQLVPAHITLRAGIWYWRRRLPASLVRGTSAASGFPVVRLSLRTRDRRTALARARQLDALLERTITVNAPGSITVSGFAAIARRHLLTEMEAARAGRAPDEPRVHGGVVEIPIDPALLPDLRSFLRVADHVQPDEMPDLPAHLAATIITAMQSARASQPVGSPTPLASAHGRSQAALGRAMLARRALITNDRSFVQDVVDRVALSAGIEIPPALRPMVERAGLRVLEEVFREEARRELGVYAESPEADPSLGDLRLFVSGAAQGPVPQPAAALLPEPKPPEPSPSSEPASAAVAPPALAVAAGAGPFPVTLSCFVEPFFMKRATAKRNLHSMSQDRTTLRLFLEVAGDRPARDYGRRDINTFLQTLRQLPSTYGKSPRDRGVPVAEFIARAKAKGAKTLGDTTVKRHLSALSVFFKFLVDEGELSLTQRNDIVGEHDFNLGNARDARDAWRSDEIRALFASPVWMGCDPASPNRTSPGPEVIRDGFFWLPLLGFHQGGRLEEMADLRRKDIFRLPDDLWMITITDEHRSLKNPNAKRCIPVHPELIRLGFLEYVARVAPTPDDPVFPDLEPQGVQKKRGPAVTRWFGRYRKAIGVYREGVAMHSARHNLETRLREHLKVEADKHRLNYLAGHALGTGEGPERYFKGPEAKATARLLARLSYPEIQLTHLYLRERGDFSTPSGW